AQKKQMKSLIKEGLFQKDSLYEEKGSLFSVREAISADDFENIVLEQEKLLTVCENLETIAVEKNEIKSRITALKTLQEGLRPYKNFTLKFSQIIQTQHVQFLLGACKANKTLEKDVALLAEKYGAELQIIPVKTAKQKLTEYLLFTAVERERKQALESELTSLGYAPCPYTFDCTAEEKLQEIQAEIQSLEERDCNLTKRATEYLPYTKPLKLLCDNSRFRMEMLRAEGDFAQTSQTFVLEGFVPAPESERVEKVIYKATQNVVLTVEDVEDKDCPPTLLKNNGLVSPYESITNTYSPPAYNEADPNPFVAIFYFIFFGIMLGDAGYGLLLALATFGVVKFCKIEKGMKSLLLVFGMGGISAVVWGLLFGGIFSIETVEPLWFSPMDDPITMLILCFGLGLLQIFVGMGYQAYDFIKNGHLADAVYDIFSWYVIFLGAGLAVLSAMFMPELPILVGLITLGVGVAVLMFGGAIRGKGFFGRIIGAVKPLYGIVNYFSDVMSYSRLFGLSLASGVIGLVFNTLASVVVSMLPGVGYAFAVIIVLIGHTLNLAIGLLGIYVHDSRLQFIEFFGRFYHGGGKLFTPLGLNLKYVTIKNQEV
ncbi:MAG: V-type ATP synthase subunit I, partial [Clostridia bacterium]|nr:V-type ATP synthase subunit I [Clostridia bacterium]